MNKSRLIQAMIISSICAAVFSFTVAGAKAAEAVYPSSQEARSFATSPGGWTSSTTASSLCVSGVTCPTITNSYQPTAGAGGATDGYLQTAEGGLLSVGIAATSSGIYESPAFTYDGINGTGATTATLKLDILSDLADFLNVPGSSAAYSVMLIDHSDGKNISVVNKSTLAGVPSSWTSFSSTISPGQLTVGHQYSIQIASVFDTPAALLPAGSVGYDNVALVADDAGSSSSGNGNNGNDGNSNNGHDNNKGNNRNGNNGHNGINGIPAAVLHAGLTTNQAVLYHKRLYVRVRCAIRKPGNCVPRAWAVTKRKHGKKLSRRSRFRIKSHRSKIIALKLKPIGNRKLKKAKRVLIKERVVIHQHKHGKHHRRVKVVFKRLKLRHAR